MQMQAAEKLQFKQLLEDNGLPVALTLQDVELLDMLGAGLPGSYIISCQQRMGTWKNGRNTFTTWAWYTKGKCGLRAVAELGTWAVQHREATTAVLISLMPEDDL